MLGQNNIYTDILDTIMENKLDSKFKVESIDNKSKILRVDPLLI